MENKEIHKNRMEKNTHFQAYIPKYIGEAFKEKLQKDGLKFSDWLKINIEKYLKKS